MVSSPRPLLSSFLGMARGAVVWTRVLVGRQFTTGNRRGAFGLAALTVIIGIAAVHVSVWWFSPGVMILPILAGGLLLWPRALRILFGVVALTLIYDTVKDRAGAGIIATIVITAVFADVLSRTREKLGVQGLRGDQMLIDLRDRIRAQGRMPDLGEGWGSVSILRAAGGASFGGDFVVSACDGKTLEVALVDVSGKGLDAGTRALLLSGAFGGLLGSVPREQFLAACNSYLRRVAAAEGFVTAVHLALDLATGEYAIASAGHPPAVHFDAGSGQWRITKAHGVVLGVVPDTRSVPELGVLRPGDALMLYTDGLVEAPGRDIDSGIAALLGEAERLVVTGFKAGAATLVQTMQREIGSSDDRALVLIWRSLPRDPRPGLGQPSAGSSLAGETSRSSSPASASSSSSAITRPLARPRASSRLFRAALSCSRSLAFSAASASYSALTLASSCLRSATVRASLAWSSAWSPGAVPAGPGSSAGPAGPGAAWPAGEASWRITRTSSRRASSS